MKKLLIGFVLIVLNNALQAQGNVSRNEGWKNIYRETAEKTSNLVHTKLDVKFDYDKKYLYGKAWITLKPHFYATDSVRLDAKGMDIKKVSLVKAGKLVDVPYTYADEKNLRVKLDRVYTNKEPYTLYIDYTAKPDELKAGGSAAIKSDKGLYFINPSGADSTKPVQIWTQGETEASSVWFPTIDRPNQKTTQEIAMTVPAKYVTLSNGKLISQKKNTNGTRTDVWKMDLPHAPYLFFMGVGDYAIVKDSYKGKEVSYYVEKPYKEVARKIFGNTPEMMQFFSEKLGYEYPWNKYAQIVGRDYVSGAMENTTASLFGEFVQQNARQLVDENRAEDVIAHELIHQWFGDLVTTESWSNLTINESFATYGEVLWLDHKLGKQAGQHKNYTDMAQYLNSRSGDKELVRFHYRDKEDMFDRVSYSKGGTILNMLRNVIGDDAFFKSLNLFLNRHKYKAAEAHDLRLAFEEVTGKDLNWFFNQWYFGSGHPKLDIEYGYNDTARLATVVVKQVPDSAKLFQMPVAIDVYEGKNRKRYNVWIENRVDSFLFPVNSKPSLINFDGDKTLVAEKKENKTIYDYTFQYNNANNYVDKREAIDYAIKHKDQAEGKNLLLLALHDDYYELRERALNNIDSADLDATAIKTIERIAQQDEKRKNRAIAISILGELADKKYTDLFLAGTKDSSYTVAGSALIALSNVDEQKALSVLPLVKKDMKGNLKAAVAIVEILAKTDADFEEMTEKFDKAVGYAKLNQFSQYITYLRKVNDVANFKKGVDKIVAFRDAFAAFNPRFKEIINRTLIELKNKKMAGKTPSNAAAIEAQAEYIDKLEGVE